MAPRPDRVAAAARRPFLLAVALLALAGLTAANWPADALPPGTQADRVLIEKGAHTLTLLRHGVVLRSYRVALGRTAGAKEREGDGRTPEGLYRIVEHKRASAFHRALRISYPQGDDITRARRLGVAPGSNIMIHGLRNGLGLIGRLHRCVDWTAGCIAVTDDEIEQIDRAVPDGTLIEIRP